MPTPISTACPAPACASSPSTGPGGGPTWRRCSSPSAIAEGRPIRLFNEGRHSRDFTYVDDIVEGVIRASDRPALPDPGLGSGRPRSRRPRTRPSASTTSATARRSSSLDFIAALERALGRQAIRELLPLQPGDVPDTFADTRAGSPARSNWRPATPVDEGVRRFVAWFRDYRAGLERRLRPCRPGGSAPRGHLRDRNAFEGPWYRHPTIQPVRQVLLVLGMHRSGTSATAGLLAQLGRAHGAEPDPGRHAQPPGLLGAGAARQPAQPTAGRGRQRLGRLGPARP